MFVKDQGSHTRKRSARQYRSFLNRKNIMKDFQIRLSNNSMNEETFKEAAWPYNAALKENRHKSHPARDYQS